MRKKNESAARESKLASGWTVGGEAGDGPAAKAAAPEGVVAESAAALPTGPNTEANPGIYAEADELPPQMSNATLVILGVFGGIYLMYTWVWFSWAEYHSTANDLVAAASGSLGGILQQVVLWVGPLAPIAWFLSTLLLNRGAKTWKLAMWILIGAVVLVPLPMIMWGA